MSRMRSDGLISNSAWSRKLIYDEPLDSVSYQGLLTTMCDARNVCAYSHYDQLNRPTGVTYSDSRMPAVTNNYDQADSGYFNKGKLTESITGAVADDTGTSWNDSIPETRLNYDFDLMGRTVTSTETVDANAYKLEYTYNLGGQLTQEKYPSGRLVNVGYDEAGRLATVNSGAGHVYADAFTYAGHGALSGFTLGNGATVSLGYGTNGRLQLSDITLAKNGTTLQKYEYSYGQIVSGSVDATKNNGQLAQVDSWIGTDQQYRQQYQYDSLGRLTESTEKYGTSLASTAYDVVYHYDAFGNREQHASANSGNTTIAQKWVEAGDISKVNNRYGTGVSYDDAGNITADPRFRNMLYGYDANGRQNYAAAADGSGPTNTIYDGAGQRVAQRIGGVLNLMVYDAGGKLVAEYGAAAPSTANIQYVTTNYQGSTSVITDTAGAVVSRHDYLPFGEEIGAGVGSRTTGKLFSQTDGVRQKYAGMETDDATGMATTLWRKDDNWSGRWTSPDPYTGSMTAADPQSFNRYTYCDNDPVNGVDPSGLSLADIGVYQTENPEAAEIADNVMVSQIHDAMFPSDRPAEAHASASGGGNSIHEAGHAFAQEAPSSTGGQSESNGTIPTFPPPIDSSMDGSEEYQQQQGPPLPEQPEARVPTSIVQIFTDVIQPENGGPLIGPNTGVIDAGPVFGQGKIAERAVLDQYGVRMGPETHVTLTENVRGDDQVSKDLLARKVLVTQNGRPFDPDANGLVPDTVGALSLTAAGAEEARRIELHLTQDVVAKMPNAQGRPVGVIILTNKISVVGGVTTITPGPTGQMH